VKRVALVLAVLGFISFAIGIVMPFANPLLQHQVTIPAHGHIVYPGEELKSAESNSHAYVDARGYMPIIVGVGFLSIAFLHARASARHACMAIF